MLLVIVTSGTPMVSIGSKLRIASNEDLPLREKARAIWLVMTYKPVFMASIILFSFFTALLEGIGLSFLIPIVEVVQAGDPDDASGAAATFAEIFATLGIPFTLGFVLLGVGVVLTVRYFASFMVGWFRVALQVNYQCYLQTTAYERALDARVGYFDKHGSDDILNAIVTQAGYAGKAIRDFVRLFEQVLLGLMYLLIVLYMAPALAIGAIVVFVVLAFGIRYLIEPGYTVGARVAEANERIQQTAQAGTQGIRDIKLYTKTDDMRRRFIEWIDIYAGSMIKLARNEEGIDNFYNLATVLMVIGLFYVAFVHTTMGLGELGVFLFAMAQLAPIVSKINYYYYKIEGRLPHLVRTQQFIRELEMQAERDAGDRPAPRPVTSIEFDDVSFTYNTDEGDEQVLKHVSFSIDQGEFVAFVGQSGAGKSTLVALLARMYEPDSGEIRAAGVPITAIDLTAWRSRIAFVRQDPFIFNDTLRANITLWDPGVSEAKVREACEIAQVTEFLSDLPNGLDTLLGDNGVRLSGGQRQRVSLARALLKKDADVLVLDEATSHLDTDIETTVQAAIETMDRGYAIIAIAHRLSTVVNADRIYTLEKGMIVETGTHWDLVATGGKYAQLYATQ